MSDNDQNTVVNIKFGDSPLTNFILMFTGQMNVLDEICKEMSKIVGDIEQKEKVLEAMCDELYRKLENPRHCPSLRCNCWTLLPITRYFLDSFKELKEQKNQFRALRDKANSYIDCLKKNDDEPQPLDLTIRSRRATLEVVKAPPDNVIT